MLQNKRPSQMHSYQTCLLHGQNKRLKQGKLKAPLWVLHLDIRHVASLPHIDLSSEKQHYRRLKSISRAHKRLCFSSSVLGSPDGCSCKQLRTGPSVGMHGQSTGLTCGKEAESPAVLLPRTLIKHAFQTQVKAVSGCG